MALWMEIELVGFPNGGGHVSVIHAPRFLAHRRGNSTRGEEYPGGHAAAERKGSSKMDSYVMEC